MKRPNPVRVDPTRTGGIVRGFTQAAHSRMVTVGRAIMRAVVYDNAFGLGEYGYIPVQNELSNVLVCNAAVPAFDFTTRASQVDRFRDWISDEIEEDVLGTLTGDQWWADYILRGYEKGAGRSIREVLGKRGEFKPVIPAGAGELAGGFYLSGREDFMFRAFGSPVNQARVKNLVSRVFTELNGVTDDMARRLTRVLADGIIQGLSPREVARNMMREIDFSRARAENVARTETIRAHAEGQLDGMEAMGVDQVGVMVELTTTGDSAVCVVCNDLKGVVLTISEARGVIPVHPSCRCAWVPANVGEDRRGQVRGKGPIEEAIKRALDRERAKSSVRASWPLRTRPIAGKRPKSFV